MTSLAAPGVEVLVGMLEEVLVMLEKARVESWMMMARQVSVGSPWARCWRRAGEGGAPPQVTTRLAWPPPHTSLVMTGRLDRWHTTRTHLQCHLTVIL